MAVAVGGDVHGEADVEVRLAEYLVSAATPFIEIEMEEDATQLEAVTVVPSPFRATAGRQ